MSKRLNKDRKKEMLSRCYAKPTEPAKSIALDFDVPTKMIYNYRVKSARKRMMKKYPECFPGKIFSPDTKKEVIPVPKLNKPFLENIEINERLKILEECKKLNNAVDGFAEKMKMKLQYMAENGIAGWDKLTKDQTYKLISKCLQKQNISGGQEIDISNYMMFLYFLDHQGMLD